MDEAERTAPPSPRALAHAMDDSVRRRFRGEERGLARPGERVDERLRIVHEVDVV